MSKKSDFQDSLKQPDQFVHAGELVLQFIERHAKTVGAIVFVAAVTGLSIALYNFIQTRNENVAAEQLYKVESRLKKAESQIRDERAKKMQDLAGLSAKKKIDAKPEQLRPVDFAKDYAPIVEALKVELKSQGSTRAAMVSSLNLSYFLVQQKQYGEALTILTTPTFRPGVGDVLGGLWRMHYGFVLLENSKADEAVKIYSEVLEAPALKPFHAEALLKTGIAYEIKGDTTKAKDTYEKLGREFPNTESSATATQYLRLMELKARG